MSDGNITLNRPLVGVIALGCLGLSAGLWLSSSDNPESSMVMGGGAGAAFFRVGLLMAALWIALPPKGQEAAWATVTPGTFVGLLLAVYAVVRFRWMAIPFIAALGLLALILKPRTKHRPPRP